MQGRSTRSCCGCFVSSLALLFQPRSPDVRPLLSCPREGGFLRICCVSSARVFLLVTGRPKGMDKMMSTCDATPPPGLARSSPTRVARNRCRALKLRVRKAVMKALAKSSASEVTFEASRDSADHSATLRDSDGETQSAAATYGSFLSQLLKTSSLGLASSFHALSETGGRQEGNGRGRQRDLFPLPLLQSWPAGLACNSEAEDGHLLTANLCLAALNHLEKGMPRNGLGSGASLAASEGQKSVQMHVCGRVHRFLSRLHEGLAGAFSWRGAFSKLEAREKSAVAVPLLGDSVDLPARAATCDPANLVPADLWSKVSAPGAIFGSQPTSTQTPAISSNSQDRREYLVLTGRELRCGKLRLRSEVRGVQKSLPFQSRSGADSVRSGTAHTSPRWRASRRNRRGWPTPALFWTSWFVLGSSSTCPRGMQAPTLTCWLPPLICKLGLDRNLSRCKNSALLLA